MGIGISWTDVYLLYRHEIRCALRETNIILYSFLVPALLYPLLVWLAMSAISFVSGQEQETVSRVALVGLPPVHAALKSRLEGEERLQLVNTTDPEADVVAGRIDAAVRFSPKPGADDAQLTVLFDGSRSPSLTARDRVVSRLEKYREGYLERAGLKLGLSLSQMQGFWWEERTVSSPQEVGRFLLGILLPFTLIVILSIGGMYPAIDSTAGERERCTWETSLTLATSRINLVVAKYLYVSTVATVAGILNLTAMIFSMRSIIAPMASEYASTLVFSLPPSALLVVLMGTVLLALSMSAGMMILASFARTFREGQAMVTPVFLMTFVPVALVADSSLEFDGTLSLVPVVNVALMWREAIRGSLSWPLMTSTVMVMLACIIASLGVATWVLGYEDLVIGSYGGSFWHFLKSRLRRDP